MAEKGHHLTLIDRGFGKQYRYTPSCGGCGWIGIPAKRRKGSIREYREHTTGVTHNLRRSSQRNLGPVPKALTAFEDLPEELRPRTVA